MTVYIVVAFPIFCFLLALLAELHRDAGSLRSLTRTLPLAIGSCVAVLLLVPVRLYVPSISASFLLSRAMTVTSLVIAGCGVLCRFRSRSAAALLVVGATVLAFFWLFNRIIV